MLKSVAIQQPAIGKQGHEDAPETTETDVALTDESDAPEADEGAPEEEDIEASDPLVALPLLAVTDDPDAGAETEEVGLVIPKPRSAIAGHGVFPVLTDDAEAIQVLPRTGRISAPTAANPPMAEPLETGRFWPQTGVGQYDQTAGTDAAFRPTAPDAMQRNTGELIASNWSIPAAHAASTQPGADSRLPLVPQTNPTHHEATVTEPEGDPQSVHPQGELREVPMLADKPLVPQQTRTVREAFVAPTEHPTDLRVERQTNAASVETPFANRTAPPQQPDPNTTEFAQPQPDEVEGVAKQPEGAATDALFKPQTTAPHFRATEPGATIPRQILQQLTEATPAAGDTIEISLSPEELGRVQLSAAKTEHGVMLVVQAERPETLDLMRRHLPELMQDLRDMGFGDISYSGERGQQQAPSGRGGSATVAAQPEDEAPIYVAKSGLDIRL
ncbi:flagellar hook-length control protein FliK [Thalassobius vesicularis]|uniref:flagellar hook-length control protein FliK n=1 Tax=Thalassobius vesicularis TaxID=1294297 RepID=UPI001B3B200E|nr:flagellar hook-length control protein FliK [Thalassobius vesicularis]